MYKEKTILANTKRKTGTYLVDRCLFRALTHSNYFIAKEATNPISKKTNFTLPVYRFHHPRKCLFCGRITCAVLS